MADLLNNMTLLDKLICVKHSPKTKKRHKWVQCKQQGKFSIVLLLLYYTTRSWVRNFEKRLILQFLCRKCLSLKVISETVRYRVKMTNIWEHTHC